MEELRNCPFCGGKAALYYASSCPYVKCTKCGSKTGKYLNVEYAIKNWNRRAEETKVEE